MKILGAVLYEGFELLDLFGPLEMFGNVGPELKIITLAETVGPIRAAQGTSTLAEYDYNNHPQLDLVLVPGGIGTLPQLNNEAILDFVRQAATLEVLMSVCSGSAILAKAGILNGKKATSNKLFFSLATMQSDQVEWVESARWVEDGNIFTSSGVSAGTDMALGVIAKLYGQAQADKIAMLTEYIWQSDSSQDPFTQYLNQGNI